MASSGMLRRVALVRTDVSEELNVSFIGVTRIGELGTAGTGCIDRVELRRLHLKTRPRSSLRNVIFQFKQVEDRV
jgi:hypothetical protein